MKTCKGIENHLLLSLMIITCKRKKKKKRKVKPQTVKNKMPSLFPFWVHWKKKKTRREKKQEKRSRLGYFLLSPVHSDRNLIFNLLAALTNLRDA
jgi:hypothetical protein